MRKALVLLFGTLVILYCWLAFVGVEPKDRRPGTLLSGEVTPLPDSWDFLADVPEVHLETRPWFGIPFSVTVVVANDEDALYVPSLYDAPMSFPGTKYWNTVVVRDPNVRLRVKDALYEMQIAPITEPAEFDQAFAALARKFPFWQQQNAGENSERKFALLRLSPR